MCKTRTHRQACVDQYKTANGCQICGYKQHPRALCFDHLPEHDKAEICKNGKTSADPTKSIRGGGMWMFYAPKHPISSLLREIKKCRILCMNCHMEITYNNRKGNIVVSKDEDMSLETLENNLNNV